MKGIILSNKGQTLIEVLIAFATLAVVITSSTLAVISALNNAEFIKNQHLATQYAQQGMEIVRSIRENDYHTFLSITNPDASDPTAIPPLAYYYCMAKSCSTLNTLPNDQCGQVTAAGVPCALQNVDSFVRGVMVDRTVSNTCNTTGQTTPPTEVTVSVSWIDGRCPRGVYCHSSSVTSCLGPINSVTTP